MSRMCKPMFPEFNRLVWRMIEELDIQYTLTNDQYATFEEMKMDAEMRGGVFSVNRLHSDCTVFGDADTNWAFRAWHDSCHIKMDADFSRLGEERAMGLMMAHLDEKFDLNAPLLWYEIIQVEVMGQFDYLEKWGEFPVDQRAFMAQELALRGYDIEVPA